MIKMSRKAKKAMAVALTAGMLASTATTPVFAAGEGWKQNATGWWYENADGTYPASKWQKIGEKWYYFDANGYMVSGWQSINGNWYYFGAANDGAMKDGWFKDTTGKWSYADAGNGAIYVNKWAKSGSDWYYLAANGYMQEGGWVNDTAAGEWYFLNKAGVMQTGIIKVEDKVYYLKDNGAMVTGEKKIGDVTYTFDATGAATGEKIPTPTKAFKTDGTSVALDPEEKELSVTSVTAITKNADGDFVVTALLNKEVTADTLKDTSLTLTNGSLVAKTKFDSVTGATAVYKITNASVLTPGDSSADGTYVVTATGIDVATGVTAAYGETLVGNAIQGIVYYINSDGDYVPVKNATVTVGNKTVTTDANGYYNIYSDPGAVAVKVSADGYFEGAADGVIVSRNYTTAQNIKLEVYNQEKLFITGVVVDEKTSKAVSGAKVELQKKNATTGKYEALGDVTTTTDGKFVFTNKAANTTGTAFSGVQTKDFNSKKLSEKDTYKIVITKDYNATGLGNLCAAYHKQEYDVTMNQYAAQTNLNTKTIKPVEKIDNVALSMSWDSAINVNASTNLKVTFMDQDGKTPLGTAPTVNVKPEKRKMVSEKNIVTDLFSGNPTLPSGTYALVLEDTTNSNDAIKVIVVKVEEGKDITVTGTFEEENKANINAIVTKEYTDTLKEKYTTYTNGGDVEVLDTNAAVDSGNNVTVAYEVYQKTSEGLDVLVQTTSPASKFVYAYDGGVKAGALNITASTIVSKLEAGKEYICKPVGDYIDSSIVEVKNQDTTPKDNTNVLNSAAVIDKIDLQAATFYEANGTTAVTTSSDTTKILSIKIKDASGKVVAEVKKPKDTKYDVDAVITIADKFDDAGNLKHIPAGKYTAEINIDGYEPFETSKFDLIDFQTKTITLETMDVKKVAKTTVSGAIRFEDGTAPSGSASIVVYDANGVVVAAQNNVLSSDIYTIVDGTNGAKLTSGTYTMVVRGANFETIAKEIQLDANKTTQQDIIVTAHTGAVAKLTVRDTNTIGYGSTNANQIELLDKYYVEAGDAVRDPGSLLSALTTPGVTGSYAVSPVGGTSDVEFTTAAQLSKGQYTVKIDAVTGKSFGNSSKDVINIKTVNGTSYANLVVTAIQSAKTVNLTVKFADAATPIVDDTKSWVVVEDVNGTVLAINDDNNDSQKGVVTFMVSENETYVVKVFSDNKYVGSNKVTVQDFDQTVSVSLDKADR